MKKESDMWSEKFRPQTLNEVLGQDQIVKRLKAFVTAKNMPHLLFSGPRGTGKTTCGHAVANELYGSMKKSDFQELNASDERGIGVVRGKIKEFAAVETLNEDVTFKVILLDEADRLTPEAQSALRRTMEEYSSSTRFILCCNYPSKIIEPIQDRCFIIRFPYVPEEAIYERTKIILDGIHGMSYEDDGIRYLSRVSKGSFRRLYTYLQVLVQEGNPITESLLRDTLPAIVSDDIEVVCTALLNGELHKSEKEVLKMYYSGVQMLEVLEGLYNYFSTHELNTVDRIKYLTWIGNTDYYITVGANPLLQVRCLLAKIVDTR